MSKQTHFGNSLKEKFKGLKDDVKRSLSPNPKTSAQSSSRVASVGPQHVDSESILSIAPSTMTQDTRSSRPFDSPAISIDAGDNRPALATTDPLAEVRSAMSRVVVDNIVSPENPQIKFPQERVSQPATASLEDDEDDTMPMTQVNNSGTLAGAQNVMLVNPTFNVADTINFNSMMNTSGGGAAGAPRRLNSSPRFSGRKDVLERLQEHFKPRSTGERKLFLLFGMGGIGKTQICLKFSEISSNMFSEIFWIDASSPDTIMVSLKAVLHCIGSLLTQWLLIFDNADGAPEVVEEFLPPGSRGNILITSRNPSVRRITSAENSLELAEMDKEDAVTLLLKASCLDALDEEHREIAGEIVSELYCLPLAVDQAGAAIESGLCDIGDYHQVFSEHRRDLMSNPFFLGASKYERTVYGTWELSFNEIRHRADQPNDGNAEAAKTAVLILQTCAFYHYDNISEDIFRFAAQQSRERDIEAEVEQGLPLAVTFLDYSLLPVDQNDKWNAYFFRKGLQVLLSFSLIKKGSGPHSQSFSIHPLVHSWSRDRLGLEEQQRLCCMANIILSCGISFGTQSQDYAFRQSLLLHIKANEQYSNEMGLERNYYDDAYSSIAMVFDEGGYKSEAEQLWRQVLDMRKKGLGDEHPDTLTSMGNLATTLEDGEELQMQVLEIRKRTLGDEHPDTLISMGNLAATYSKQGDWDKAEELEVQVMEKRKRVLGAEDINTLISMGNLARTYTMQGQWEKAEKLGVQVLDIRKRVLGAEHPHTVNTIAVLGLTYSEQGQWEKAEELYMQFLDISKRMLGAGHPNTLVGMSHLASTYTKQEKYEKASELLAQILDSRKRELGAEHPETLVSTANLAVAYLEQAQWEKAEKLGLQFVEMSKRVNGAEHPDTLTGMANLAATYVEQKQWKKAEEMGVQILEGRKRVLGAEHPNTLRSVQFLVDVKPWIESLEISES
ncbi:hypothetical protein B0H34DRAFT_251302 [Crassisporium funariophilum]|nr:hypothetical protein B0H34DRAFT_251302 [Crassisporium funariophilum]